MSTLPHDRITYALGNANRLCNDIAFGEPVNIADLHLLAGIVGLMIEPTPNTPHGLVEAGKILRAEFLDEK